MTIKDRIYGALFGFAIGDAMGATTEFMSAKEIKENYGKVTDIIGGGWLNLPAGNVTDDTEMMLLVYQAMQQDKSLSVEGKLQILCGLFKDWLSCNPVDVGNTCRAAISDPRSTDPDEWRYRNFRREETLDRPALGNGALMRCLVPCLLGDKCFAIKQGKLTHNSTIHEIYITTYFEDVQMALRGHKSACLKHRDPTGYVVNTLHNAEYWLCSTDSFRGAIIEAVNDGGDADTIAALTGGLVGAYYGYDAIPEPWVKALNPVVVNDLNSCAKWVLKQLS